MSKHSFYYRIYEDFMKQLLVEKYRPSTIENYIFQNEETERTVKKWLKAKEIPNVLMVSNAGQGKTTLARIIINELNIQPSDVKVVNGSLVTGIGFVREELEPWMRKISFGNFKVVHIEEADRLTKHAQDALKMLIEESSDHTRFIFTANNIKRIIPPMLSRFQVLNMEGISEDALIDKVLNIMGAEGIFPEDDDESIILQHVEKYAPDLRKIINSIDESTTEDDNGNRTLHKPSESSESSGGVDEWEKLLAADTIDPVALLELTEVVNNDNYDLLYETMYHNLQHYEDTAKAVVIISKYLDRAQSTANQRLTLDACIYELFFLED